MFFWKLVRYSLQFFLAIPTTAVNKLIILKHYEYNILFHCIITDTKKKRTKFYKCFLNPMSVNYEGIEESRGVFLM